MQELVPAMWILKLKLHLGNTVRREFDPEAYLRHVTANIADHPINQVNELLPWRVAASLHLAPA